jgi:hypothetical protein
MKPLKFRLLAVKPLPVDPTILDYVEFVFQWVTHWFVIDIEGYPAFSGMLTGLLLGLPLWILTICEILFRGK